MGEQQGVALDPRIETAFDDAVRADPHLLDRLATAPGAGPDAPVRDLGTDIGRRAALELAVIPLAEVRIDQRVRKPREARRLQGPRTRTREDERERVPS